MVKRWKKGQPSHLVKSPCPEAPRERKYIAAKGSNVSNVSNVSNESNVSSENSASDTYYESTDVSYYDTGLESLKSIDDTDHMSVDSMPIFTFLDSTCGWLDDHDACHPESFAGLMPEPVKDLLLLEERSVRLNRTLAEVVNARLGKTELRVVHAPEESQSTAMVKREGDTENDSDEETEFSKRTDTKDEETSEDETIDDSCEYVVKKTRSKKKKTKSSKVAKTKKESKVEKQKRIAAYLNRLVIEHSRLAKQNEEEDAFTGGEKDPETEADEEDSTEDAVGAIVQSAEQAINPKSGQTNYPTITDLTNVDEADQIGQQKSANNAIEEFEFDDEDSWTPGETRDPAPSKSSISQDSTKSKLLTAKHLVRDTTHVAQRVNDIWKKEEQKLMSSKSQSRRKKLIEGQPTPGDASIASSRQTKSPHQVITSVVNLEHRQKAIESRGRDKDTDRRDDGDAGASKRRDLVEIRSIDQAQRLRAPLQTNWELRDRTDIRSPQQKVGEVGRYGILPRDFEPELIQKLDNEDEKRASKLQRLKKKKEAAQRLLSIQERIQSELQTETTAEEVYDTLKETTKYLSSSRRTSQVPGTLRSAPIS